MLLTTLCTLALADVLVAGSPAPALSVDAFVKGDAVKSFEAGKVYVVEFWATWCGPCIASIPHLTEMQKSNPGVTFISVAGFERGGDAASNEKKVRDFVAKKGDAMGYHVAFDGDATMAKEWMMAAKRNGIPCAFVVGGDGKVAWIGNPQGSSLEDAVKAAVAKAGKSSEGTADAPVGDRGQGGAGGTAGGGAGGSGGSAGAGGSGGSGGSSKSSSSSSSSSSGSSRSSGSSSSSSSGGTKSSSSTSKSSSSSSSQTGSSQAPR